MLQFKNDFAIVELVNDSTAIMITWTGFVPSAVYRKSLDEALEIAQKHNIQHWLSDIKHMKIISVQDQEWAINDWLPRAVAAHCYSKQAVIMPEDLFGLATANNIVTTIQSQLIEIKNFTHLEKAKAWLAQSSNI